MHLASMLTMLQTLFKQEKAKEKNWRNISSIVLHNGASNALCMLGGREGATKRDAILSFMLYRCPHHYH
jgi:hypothetical protein